MKKSCALYQDGCCLELEYNKQQDDEVSFTSTFTDVIRRKARDFSHGINST